AEFPAVVGLPVRCQVQNQRDAAMRLAAMLVNVACVALTGRVPCVMELAALQAEVEVLVKRQSERFRPVQEAIPGGGPGVRIQPMNAVAPNLRYATRLLFVPHAGFLELARLPGLKPFLV